MVIKIVPNAKENPPTKLADAELHFTEGVLENLYIRSTNQSFFPGRA